MRKTTSKRHVKTNPEIEKYQAENRRLSQRVAAVEQQLEELSRPSPPALAHDTPGKKLMAQSIQIGRDSILLRDVTRDASDVVIPTKGNNVPLAVALHSLIAAAIDYSRQDVANDTRSKIVMLLNNKDQHKASDIVMGHVIDARRRVTEGPGNGRLATVDHHD
jgi:hypothetical protein